MFVFFLFLLLVVLRPLPRPLPPLNRDVLTNCFLVKIISQRMCFGFYFLIFFLLAQSINYRTCCVYIWLSSRCLPRYLVTKLLQQQSAYLPSLTLITTKSLLHLFTGNFRKDIGECFYAFPPPCHASTLNWKLPKLWLKQGKFIHVIHLYIFLDSWQTDE